MVVRRGGGRRALRFENELFYFFITNCVDSSYYNPSLPPPSSLFCNGSVLFLWGGGGL